MPSPLGHVLGGLIVGLAAQRRAPIKPPFRELALCAAAACAPDIDFLWGRHSMETHSVGFAAAAGLVAWFVARSRGHATQNGWGATRLAFAVTAAVLSHVLFDWLGSDDNPPVGVMALWPLSDRFYFADAYVFATITRRYWMAGFVAHNLWAVAREILLLGPMVALLWWWRQRSQSAAP
jgi:membrane-bound metal-dependent hydrolase YbcI (DUF457 family)